MWQIFIGLSIPTERGNECAVAVADHKHSAQVLHTCIAVSTLYKGKGNTLLPSSSLAFKDGLQTSGLMVLMNVTVCTRSSLEAQSFFCKERDLGASAVSLLPCVTSRTAEHAVGFVSAHLTWAVCVSHRQCVYVTWAVRVSHRQCVRVTWAVRVTHGQCVSHR